MDVSSLQSICWAVVDSPSCYMPGGNSPVLLIGSDFRPSSVEVNVVISCQPNCASVPQVFGTPAYAQKLLKMFVAVGQSARTALSHYGISVCPFVQFLSPTNAGIVSEARLYILVNFFHVRQTSHSSFFSAQPAALYNSVGKTPTDAIRKNLRFSIEIAAYFRNGTR